MTLWTVASQASLSMGFSRQEYWSGVSFPTSGDLPNPGIKPTSLSSPALAAGFFTFSTTCKAPRIEPSSFKSPGSASRFFPLAPLARPLLFIQFSSVSRVLLFVTPWTAAHQASLSITNSRSLLKLMSIELVVPSNHLILCHSLLLHLQSFPASGSFQMSQFFTAGGQSIGVSASASVFPMNTQD